MSQYRAYIIGSDGEFLNSVSLECADDEIAVKADKAIGWRPSYRTLAVHPKDSHARPQPAANISSMTEFVEWLTGTHDNFVIE